MKSKKLKIWTKACVKNNLIKVYVNFILLSFRKPFSWSQLDVILFKRLLNLLFMLTVLTEGAIVASLGTISFIWDESELFTWIWRDIVSELMSV